jgi:hypothetical protein
MVLRAKCCSDVARFLTMLRMAYLTNFDFSSSGVGGISVSAAGWVGDVSMDVSLIVAIAAIVLCKLSKLNPILSTLHCL